MIGALGYKPRMMSQGNWETIVREVDAKRDLFWDEGHDLIAEILYLRDKHREKEEH